MSQTYKLTGEALVADDAIDGVAAEVAIAFVSHISMDSPQDGYTATDDLWTLMMQGKSDDSDTFIFESPAEAEGYTATDDLWTLMIQMETESVNYTSADLDLDGEIDTLFVDIAGFDIF